MILINECRIKQNQLIIDASVDNALYYKYIGIDSITIDTDETFSETGPSSEPVYSITIEELYTLYSSVSDYSDTEDSDNTETMDASSTPLEKHLRLKLSAKDLGLEDLNSSLFFIYIKAKGYPAYNTPCGKDSIYTIGVATNMLSVYSQAMQYIKTIDSCDIPRDFIDFILKYKALELAIETGNYSTAIDYYKRLFTNTTTISNSSDCGCNG